MYWTKLFHRWILPNIQRTSTYPSKYIPEIQEEGKLLSQQNSDSLSTLKLHNDFLALNFNYYNIESTHFISVIDNFNKWHFIML